MRSILVVGGRRVSNRCVAGFVAGVYVSRVPSVIPGQVF